MLSMAMLFVMMICFLCIEAQSLKNTLLPLLLTQDYPLPNNIQPFSNCALGIPLEKTRIPIQGMKYLLVGAKEGKDFCSGVLIDPKSLLTPHNANHNNGDIAVYAMQHLDSEKRLFHVSFGQSPQILSPKPISGPSYESSYSNPKMAEEQGNQSFIRKYWYIVLPIALVLLLAPGGSEESSSGNR